MTGSKSNVRQILNRLKKQYPDAHCSLDHRDPFQLLAATILSAQCTDARVNIVTKDLFRRYPTPRAMADADPEELAAIIRSTGFYRNKTKSLIGMARAITEEHGGKVPSTLEQLVKLPGVGRKTANVVLGNAFNIDEGIVVDTHVKRISRRLGLTREDTPEKIEQDLMKIVPRSDWTLFPHLMIHHGREICVARKPKCEICTINDLCPSRAASP